MTNWLINSRIVNAETVNVDVVFVNGHKVRWRIIQDAMDDFRRHLAGELRLTGPRYVSVPETSRSGITREQCAGVLGVDNSRGPSSITVAFGPRVLGGSSAFCGADTSGGFLIWIGVSSPMLSLHALRLMFYKIGCVLLTRRRSFISQVLRHELYHTLGVPSAATQAADKYHCTNSHCILSGYFSWRKWLWGRIRFGTRFQHELCEDCRREIESARLATKQLIPPDVPYDAMEHLDQIITLNPDNPEVYLRRAEEHVKRRGWEKALHDYNRAWDLGPADKAILCLRNRGATFWYMGQYRQAADDYERCLHMKGDDIRTLQSLASLLATCPDSTVRDGQRAVMLARQACELAKWRRPDLLALLASAFAEAGDFEQAARHQEKALALSPDSQEYKSHLEMYKAEQARRIVPT